VGDALETVPHLREPAARARLRGQLAALEALPRYLRLRRRVQRSRRVSVGAIERILGDGGGGMGR
jgi:hypothetical protein